MRAVAPPKRLRERAHEQRLAEPGHAFEQHVARRRAGREHLVDGLVLADDGLAELGANSRRELCGGLHILHGILLGS